MENIVLDKNLVVKNRIDKDDVVMYDAEEAPFKIYGLMRDGEKFVRMPESVAEQVSEKVVNLNRHSAGARVRFRTDSEYVAVRIFLNSVRKSSHFPLTASIGCDVYSVQNGENRYRGTVIPPTDVENQYEGVVNLRPFGMHEVTVDLPLYSWVEKIQIGVSKGCKLLAPLPYKISKPVVFYGSSITQGCAASRAGTIYEAQLSRALDFDYINLGFSGNARGEQCVAEYIAGLDMSAFVLDYDHNAPSIEHLQETHYPFFETVRKAHPDLPILMLSRPKKHLSEKEKTRKEIIKSTYLKAKENGDKNVWFIAGDDLIDDGIAEIATVDGSHPTDVAFYSMAKAIAPVLSEMLNKKD